MYPRCCCRLSSCRYHCGNGSTAFLLDGIGSTGLYSGGGGGAAAPYPLGGLEAPSIEQSLPSSPPHLCLVDVSKKENCILMMDADSSFSYNRSLRLDSAFSVSDGVSQACHFRQEDFSYEGHYYEDMVCRTQDHCSVVCHATEDVSVSRYRRSMCVYQRVNNCNFIS